MLLIPGTGNGNGEPATGNREPGTGNLEPGTGNRQPGTGNRQPATGNRQPATGNRQPATGNRQPATGNRERESWNKCTAFNLDIFDRVQSRYLTRSLRSLVRYRVEHSKINFISPRAHVLFSIYNARAQPLFCSLNLLFYHVLVSMSCVTSTFV